MSEWDDWVIFFWTVLSNINQAVVTKICCRKDTETLKIILLTNLHIPTVKSIFCNVNHRPESNLTGGRYLPALNGPAVIAGDIEHAIVASDQTRHVQSALLHNNHVRPDTWCLKVVYYNGLQIKTNSNKTTRSKWFVILSVVIFYNYNTTEQQNVVSTV